MFDISSQSKLKLRRKGRDKIVETYQRCPGHDFLCLCFDEHLMSLRTYLTILYNVQNALQTGIENKGNYQISNIVLIYD